MKSLFKIFAATLLCVFFSTNIQAQAEGSDKPVEASFTVHGVCNMCKSRIESAALIKGVKFANWDKKTQVLNVVFKPNKVAELAIHEAVAKIGHDTDKAKASNEIYNELPGCCAYRDGVEVH